MFSLRTSARKPRKPKSDGEEPQVAHPAHLSAPPHEEVDGGLEVSSLGQSSKRRLYNAKCPDILLPSSKKVKLKILKRKSVIIYFNYFLKEEADGVDFPKRMATRSRKP
jgi:hypothetical protein